MSGESPLSLGPVQGQGEGAPSLLACLRITISALREKSPRPGRGGGD